MEVYIREDLERKLRALKEWFSNQEEKGKEGKMILGGDFNVRTGKEGERIRIGKEEDNGKNRV